MEKRARKENKFRGTEVGAIIEALRSEIKPVLEAIPDMQNKLGGILEQLSMNTEDIAVLKTAAKNSAEKIEINRTLISGNTEDLAVLKTAVKSSAEKIEINRTLISGNTEDLAVLKTAAKNSAEKIEINRTLISGNTEDLAVLKTTAKNSAEKIDINRTLISRVLEELRSKVDRKEFEILEKKVASLAN